MSSSRKTDVDRELRYRPRATDRATPWPAREDVEPPDSDDGGVREPRVPRPKGGGPSAASDIPEDAGAGEGEGEGEGDGDGDGDGEGDGDGGDDGVR